MKIFHQTISRAFSLIEVVFALGIIAKIGVTMIGLLPSGFKNVKEAGDLAVISRILQSISSDALTSDWDEYEERFSQGGKLWQYYDDQGNTLDDKGAQNHIYTALVQIADPASSDSSISTISLPGDESMQLDRSKDLRKIVIRVSNLPGELGVAALKRSDNRSEFSEHSVVISNMSPALRDESP